METSAANAAELAKKRPVIPISQRITPVSWSIAWAASASAAQPRAYPGLYTTMRRKYGVAQPAARIVHYCGGAMQRSAVAELCLHDQAARPRIGEPKRTQNRQGERLHQIALAPRGRRKWPDRSLDQKTEYADGCEPC